MRHSFFCHNNWDEADVKALATDTMAARSDGTAACPAALANAELACSLGLKHKGAEGFKRSLLAGSEVATPPARGKALQRRDGWDLEGTQGSVGNRGESAGSACQDGNGEGQRLTTRSQTWH